jgi:SMC interacting uncharacterized protein involved in chromosome segregation
MKRSGRLKQDTINLIEALDDVIEVKEKELEALKAEKKMLQRKLDEQ